MGRGSSRWMGTSRPFFAGILRGCGSGALRSPPTPLLGRHPSGACGIGAEPSAVRKYNTRKLSEREAKSNARKGQGRNSLAGSRGSAPCRCRAKPCRSPEAAPLVGMQGAKPLPERSTRKLSEREVNSNARKGQGRNSLAGSRGSAPCRCRAKPCQSPEAAPLAEIKGAVPLVGAGQSPARLQRYG